MNTEEIIRKQLGDTVDVLGIDLPYRSGKVRETFEVGQGRLAIVTTDRISAFDFVFGTVPQKGAVLNGIASWWFNQIPQGVATHYIGTPDPNVMLVKKAQVLPIEIIVRGYLTGSTKTSAWYAYQNLGRQICGLEMPPGMVQHQKFDAPIITPTTKPDIGHDEAISREEIISQGLVSEELYTQAEEYAMKLFVWGTAVAATRGLILVDTKYEMGLDEDGNLMLIDEVHTPDSSRFWVAGTYAARMGAGESPDQLDKEFFRGLMIGAGFDVEREYAPEAARAMLTDDIRVQTACKYLELYEKMTGEAFALSEDGADQKERIAAVVQSL